MVEIAINQYYRIVDRNAVFLAIQDRDGLTLKDLNRSRKWIGGNVVVGYFEGYRVDDKRLIFTQYDFVGASSKEGDVSRPQVSLDLVEPCGIRTERVDMSKWGPSLE